VSGFAPTTLRFRDGHLGLVEVGEGSPVAYLHGMLGNPGQHRFLTELADHGHRVIAPSLPGFTGSSEPDGLRTLHDWVVATSELVDVAGVTGMPIVASGVGAMMALELAAIRPEAFSAMVLIAPFGLWDADEPIADPFATTLTAQRRLLTVDPAASASFFDDPGDLAADELVEHGVDRYLTRTAAAQLIWPLPEFGLVDRLHRVQQPVTLLHGAADELIPVSYVARWSQALPNVVASHVIDGAGHQAEFDKPAEVAALAAAALST
jgi:pimeloyl-ACP methyl ester carboxylesterase